MVWLWTGFIQFRIESLDGLLWRAFGFHKKGIIRLAEHKRGYYLTSRATIRLLRRAVLRGFKDAASILDYIALNDRTNFNEK
jgi:hypothetical protein